VVRGTAATGQYRLNEDGTISANEFNPFRGEVGGLRLDQFLELIEAEVR
jgi:hypothetical protein